jgi:hypothetical protein
MTAPDPIELLYVQTNLSQLPKKLMELADRLVLGTIEGSDYYGQVRTLIHRASTCGAIRVDRKLPCMGSVHHSGDHFYETANWTAEWPDADCVQAHLHAWYPSPYAPVGTRVYGAYWRDHYDVLSHNEGGSITVREVETGRTKTHCTSFENGRDKVFGPIPEPVMPPRPGVRPAYRNLSF